MAEVFLIDQYQESAASGVLERAQWAADAYDHYGMTPDTAVITGTRALDMHGIDGRLPGSKRKLDLDVVVTPSELDRLQNENPCYYTEDDIDDIFELPHHSHFQIKSEPKLDAVSLMYAGRDSRRVDYETASAQSQVVSVLGRSGLYRVVMPYAAAAGKLSGEMPKDVLGVVYGHVSAYNQGLEVVKTSEWQDLAQRAMDMADKLDPYHKPDWLGGLALHPAFNY